MINNPFILYGYESEKYFCDRKTETAELKRLVTNGNNVALIAPRRIGKTGHGTMYELFSMTQQGGDCTQSAIKGLLEKNFVTAALGEYEVYDKFFALCILHQQGFGT